MSGPTTAEALRALVVEIRARVGRESNYVLLTELLSRIEDMVPVMQQQALNVARMNYDAGYADASHGTGR